MKTVIIITIIANIISAIYIKEFHSALGWIAALILISDKNYNIYKNS